MAASDNMPKMRAVLRQVKNWLAHSSAHTVGPASKAWTSDGGHPQDMVFSIMRPRWINQLARVLSIEVTMSSRCLRSCPVHAKEKMYSSQNMTAPLSLELLLMRLRVKNRQPLPIPRVHPTVLTALRLIAIA
ncbi:hypothetical protein TCAL_16211 [Tigriopus californicus]|uniref:Uncharacterized protein n=1 Tax=Tigriopus californicus TaxID=6832 RepID=A0A553P455_TIGCA|nr:hypothetical protein TCAL_16211 [Tigriopus californicus]